MKGEIGVKVIKGKTHNLQLILAEGRGLNLLGRSWIQIHGIDWNGNVSKVKSKVQGFSSGTEVIEQYPDLFKEELGILKGPKVKIYVNGDAEPSFNKARPVSFPYRELVVKEIVQVESNGTSEVFRLGCICA